MELFEDVPSPDVVIVPIGLGSGICGVSLVRERLSPGTKVIGVQAEQAPAVYLSWKEKRFISTERAETFADGLATRVPAALTQSIINRLVDDIVTISEEEIATASRLLLFHTHNLAEGAGAASLAAALKLRAQLEGKRVVIILSGGNIDTATLRWVLQGEVRFFTPMNLPYFIALSSAMVILLYYCLLAIYRNLVLSFAIYGRPLI